MDTNTYFLTGYILVGIGIMIGGCVMLVIWVSYHNYPQHFHTPSLQKTNYAEDNAEIPIYNGGAIEPEAMTNKQPTSNAERKTSFWFIDTIIDFVSSLGG